MVDLFQDVSHVGCLALLVLKLESRLSRVVLYEFVVV